MKHAFWLTALLVTSGTAYGNPNETSQQHDSPPEVEDGRARAGAFLKQGLQEYEAAQYEEARESFGKGYEIDPRPDFLFAMGQTERLSGDCASALVFYRRFLETNPAKLHFDLVNQMIEKCEVALESSPIDKPQESAAPPVIAPAVVSQPANASPVVDYRPWHRAPIGITLLSTGAVSLLAGSTFLAMASASASSEARTYQQHQEAQDTARRRQTIGVVGLAAGTALLTSAALYYVFRNKPAAMKSVSIAAADDQLSASLHMSF